MSTTHAISSRRHPSLSNSHNGALFANWIGALFSFEALFLLYLFAGHFKGDTRFEFIPVDITALFLCVSGLVGTLVCCQRGFRLPKECPRFLVVSTLFFGYLVITYLWSCGIEYAWEKCQNIGILTFYSAVACAAVISSSRQRLERFFYLLVAFAFWIAFERLGSIQQNNTASTDFVLGGNYLSLGRVIGMATLVCLVYGLKNSHSIRQRSLLYLGVGFFSVVLLLAGGRMPCLATLAATVIIPLVNWNQSKKATKHRKGSFFAMLCVSVVAAHLFWSYGSNKSEFRTIQRLEAFLNADAYGDYENGRSELWRSAMQYWRERPLFGHGLGSFPVLFRNEDSRSYPHNLFLELGVEAGLVGVLLMLLLLYVSYRNIFSPGRIADDPQRVLILVLLVNAFCNVMVSGDIPDNRIFFGLLGMTCLIDSRKVSTREKNRPSYVRPLSV